MSDAFGFRTISKDAEVLKGRWVSPRVSSDAYLQTAKSAACSDWTDREWKQFCQRFHGLVTRLCMRAWPHIDNEMYKDCQQEVDLLLWQLRHKLRALPEGNREAYASLCVRRRALRSLSGEMRRRRRYTSLTSPGGWDYLPETVPGAMRDSCSFPNATLSIEQTDLLNLVRDGDLFTALKRLPSHDYDILNLFFGWGMSDPEIAHYLGKTSVMIKARRNRAIDRLRRALTPIQA